MLLIAFALLRLVMSGSAPFAPTPAVLACIGLAGTGFGSTMVAMLTGFDDPRLMFVIQLVPCVLTTGSPRLQEVLAVAAPTSPGMSRRSSRLPYLAVVVTQVLLVVVLLDLHADVRVWGVAAGTLAITALMVGRQLAAFHDNERLLTERSGSVP